MNARAVNAIAVVTFASVVSYSGTALGEVCYNVAGTVTTENVTSNLQMGSISLTLTDTSGIAFDETGSLVGNITGTDGFVTTFLSHTARFPQGNSFVTTEDAASLAVLPEYNYNPIRTTVDDVPCSFWIHETITEIARGANFFKNVSTSGDWEIYADGYISNCPDENENSFTLSGTLCTE